MDAAGSSPVDHDASSKRGVKRVADESNDDTLRFTKRFNLLSLDPRANGNSNYYIPVTPPPANGASAPSNSARAATVEDDSMNIDETRDRVYVQNLDAELAEIEANEPDDRLIFLPDIEKHFSRIPGHLLTTPRDASDMARQQQELVLYSVPKSLTVDEGHDSVRRAILDARQRAREKAAEESRQEDMERQYGKGGDEAVETAHGFSSGYDEEVDNDPDAMDIG